MEGSLKTAWKWTRRVACSRGGRGGPRKPTNTRVPRTSAGRIRTRLTTRVSIRTTEVRVAFYGRARKKCKIAAAVVEEM